MKTENPFEYSNYVTGKAFCNRSEEKNRLVAYIKSSQNVLIYSHRRFGKSSLIKKVFQEIETAKNIPIDTIYVDLYGTISENDFLKRCYRELSQIESNVTRLVKLVSNSVKGFRFNLSVDSKTGDTSIAPSFELDTKAVYFDGLMEILKNYSAKRKLAVAFDEFQEVYHYSGESFEKKLRSFIQTHNNICYIFAGSQRHILNDMFSSPNRAFYKSADSFPIYKIDAVHFVPWIQKRFKEGGVKITSDQARQIVDRFDNHPMHIQNFLFRLWNIIETEDINDDLLDLIEDEIIQSKELEYANILDNLTTNQKKTLILILKNQGKNLFSAESLQKVDLKTASLVTQTLQSLIAKELIEKNGVYQIQDVIFAKWLKKRVIQQ